tara:strand:+ start:903 stop:1496 length:594 start_codon:yes stop_codon:yes gene_type:complete
MNRGFTLIEVLFSLIILSIITIITTNILQSSLETEKISTERLENTRSLNSSSIVIKRDLRQIMNIPLRDFYGNFIEGTFVGDNLIKRISFNTRIKTISDKSSPIKRIEYILKDDTFIRKQFYSSNPYSDEDFFDSELIEDVSDLNIEFMHNRQWHSKWPINKNTQKKIPELIRFEFETSGKTYIWIMEPNIDYEFQN